MPRFPACLIAGATLTLPEQGVARDYAVNIPAKPLRQALLDVSHLTGLQFVFATPDLPDRRSAAVAGTCSVEHLLKALLRNSSTDFQFLTPTTVLIHARRHPAPLPRTVPAAMPKDEAILTQDIVVSAFRRDEAMNDAPISIASYSQAALDERGLGDMRAIARITPGVLYRDAWASSTNLSIRGIFSDTGAATVGVYIDDTPVQVRSLGAGTSTTNAYPGLFDLDRVEVLRGPQGALFGSGSEGGTIRFITRQPDFNTLTASAGSEAMATRGGAASGGMTATLGLPIADDRLAFRLAAFARHDGGWIDRVAYPSGQMEQRHANRSDSLAFRGSLAARLGETVAATASVFYQRLAQADTDQIWSLTSDVANDRFRNGFRFAQPVRDNFLLASLHIEAEPGGLALKSTTSYFHRRRPSTADYTDFLTELFSHGALFSLDSVPDYVSRADFHNSQDVFTQEIRLASRDGASIKWVGGLYVQRARQEVMETITEPLLPRALMAITGQSMAAYFGSALLPGGISYTSTDRATDWQAAAFGQIDLPVLPRLRATLGGRFGWTGYTQINEQGGPESGHILPSTTHHGETPLLPAFGLNWRPSEDRLIYASIAKGSRLGGGNPPVSTQRCGSELAALGLAQVPQRFDSDNIWNFELGSKLSMPGIRGTLTAAAYRYYWYNIQQTTSLPCLFRYTTNNAEARGTGAELTFDMKPAPGFTLSLTGSYTRAHYVTTTYGAALDPQSGLRVVLTPAGQALPSPPWHISGIARYEHAINRAWSTFVEVNGDMAAAYAQNYAPGSTYYDPQIAANPAVTTLRAQTGLRRGPWRVSLYADNLLNSHDALQVAHNVINSINIRYVLQRPRSIVLQLTWHSD